MDQQLGRMESAGLHRLFNIDLMVTMPIKWISNWGVNFSSGNERSFPLNFGLKLIEYVNWRWPWINSIKLRDIENEPIIYEKFPLYEIWMWSKENPNSMIFYTHSKGSYNHTISNSVWRDQLDYWLINRSFECIKLLKSNDIVAVEPHKSSDTIVSGNQFWATTDYISGLPDPRYPKEWLGFNFHDDQFEGERSRYFDEIWVQINKPRVGWIYSLTKDPYNGTYPDPIGYPLIQRL